MSNKQNISISPVKSSNIKGIGYDPDTKTMAVKFANGVYHYHGIDQKTFDEMQNAKSVGKHFYANIKGRFECKKI